MNEEAKETSVDDRLAAARLRKQLAEEKKAKDAKLRELAFLELEAKLEEEYGTRGLEFEVFDTLAGPLAIRRGEAVYHTRFAAIEDPTQADLHEYVAPCVVHPSKEKFLKMVDDHPVLYLRAANALATLYGAKSKADAGKF